MSVVPRMPVLVLRALGVVLLTTQTVIHPRR